MIRRLRNTLCNQRDWNRCVNLERQVRPAVTGQGKALKRCELQQPNCTTHFLLCRACRETKEFAQDQLSCNYCLAAPLIAQCFQVGRRKDCCYCRPGRTRFVLSVFGERVWTVSRMICWRQKAIVFYFKCACFWPSEHFTIYL